MNRHGKIRKVEELAHYYRRITIVFTKIYAAFRKNYVLVIRQVTYYRRNIGRQAYTISTTKAQLFTRYQACCIVSI